MAVCTILYAAPHTKLTYSTLLPPYINQTLPSTRGSHPKQTNRRDMPETFYEVLSLLHTRRAKMAPFSQRATAPQQLRARFSLIAVGTTAWQQAMRYVVAIRQKDSLLWCGVGRRATNESTNQPTRSQSLNFATTTATGCWESE